MNKLSLKVRILFSLAFFGVAFFATVVANYYSFQKQDEIFNHIIEKDIAVQDIAKQVKITMLQIRRSEKDFLLRKDEKYIKKVDQLLIQLKSLGNHIGKKGKSEVASLTDQVISANADSYYKNFHAATEGVLAIGQENDGLVGKAREEVHSVEKSIKENNLSDHFMVKLLMMRRHEKDLLLRSKTKYVGRVGKRIAEFNQLLKEDVLGEEKNKQFASFLERYHKHIESISKNQIEVAKNINLARADIHAIEKQLNKLIESINNDVVSSKAAIALESKKLLGVIISAAAIFTGLFVIAIILLNTKLINPLITIIDSLSHQNDINNNMSMSLSQEATHLLDSTDKQNKAIQETVASIDEINSMIMQTGDHTNESNRLIAEITNKAEEGTQTMEELMKSMNLIESTNDDLNDMVKIIDQISEKTNVINDIVFQTQLLSFNASIEAARAGQHGKGFAVVASEVANLANMSGKAAKEIATLLQSSQTRVSSIVTGNADKVSQGKEVSDHAARSFTEIVNGVRTIAEKIKGINAATREQEIGIKQAASAMQILDSNSTENTSIANNTEGLSSKLKDNAYDLDHVINDLSGMIYGGEAPEDLGDLEEDFENDDDHMENAA